MSRLSQVGIAIGALGVMITFMGLFPGVTGLSPTPGVGLIQIVGLLIGFYLLIIGAMMYVRFAFYAGMPLTLAQLIGSRLALTGLVLAPMCGLADSLGFGSHGITITGDVFLGRLQALGIILSYIMSCVGVLIYAVAGEPVADDVDTTEIDEVPD